MILTKLFQSIGIPITTRNSMVDHCDSYGNCLHKLVQVITSPGCLKGDIEIAARIWIESEQQGSTVCGISEAMGDFEVDESEDISSGSGYGRYSIRVLYADVEMAKEEVHPQVDGQAEQRHTSLHLTI